MDNILRVIAEGMIEQLTSVLAEISFKPAKITKTTPVYRFKTHYATGTIAFGPYCIIVNDSCWDMYRSFEYENPALEDQLAAYFEVLTKQWKGGLQGGN